MGVLSGVLHIADLRLGAWMGQGSAEVLIVAAGFAAYRLVIFRRKSHGSVVRTLEGMTADCSQRSSSASSEADQPSGCSPNLPPEIFQQAIRHSANGLIICDAQPPDLPIVYVSRSFEELTGYAAAEVLGQRCRFLQGEDTAQAGIADMGQAVATGSGCKVLLHSYRKGGRPFWNEVTLSPLTNNQGIVTHYIVTQIDISHYLETFKALRESELRYRHLYEETPAMFHSIDRQGRVVSVSHYWLEKLGYQRQEVIGEPLSAFVATESPPQIGKLLPLPEAHAACREMPCQFIKKDGDRMDVLLSTIAECDDIQYSGNALGVLVDVTKRKQAEENLRRSEALLRAINNLPPTGIFVMDCITNEALFVNPEFYRIWQLEHLQAAVDCGRVTGEQLLSECLGNINLGAFVATSTAQDFSDGNKVIEDEVPLLDGRTLRRIYGPIQENNETFAYLYVFEDITERKQVVEKLARATAAAEAANRAKSEFLANMSHELRSPLNAILGFTHILQGANPSTEQKEHLDIIYSSGEHLLAVISDILDISKIEAGRAVLSESEFDLYRLLDELQQMFLSTVSDQGLRLIVEKSHNLPRVIRSDRLKLRQILINLLSNAIKFTKVGTITLTARQTVPSASPDSRSQTLSFAITDTGFGIAPADQDRLFEAFVQTQSGLTAYEGTGLGLTISREYVQLLGGQITVASTLGKGSTFAFEIPTVSLENSDASTVLGSPQGRVIGLEPGQPTYKILVVDDVDLNRKLLIRLLSDVGFEVRETINGREAIALWQTWRPHLIWIDMRMPVMSGETATRRIKALDVAGKTRLIAITASAFSENKTAAIASGCDDFVSKPVRAAEIFEKMAQHLGIRYQYAETVGDSASDTVDESLTPEGLAQTPSAWQYALTQATLDLDDEAISDLAAQLPSAQIGLARAIKKCVKNLAYKELLRALQEAEKAAS